MADKKKEPPCLPGIYLVRKNEEREGIELVVLIHGKMPFLRILAWDIFENEILDIDRPNPDWVWSDMVAEFDQEAE